MSKLTANNKFNRLHDELSELFDNVGQTTVATKFLSQRILQDILELQGEFLDIERLNINTPAIKLELELVKKDRDQLKERINKLLSGHLRDRPELSKLNEYERSQFEEAGKLDEFLLNMSEKQFINAIKLYRSIFGSGLKDAKDRVEEIMGGFNR